MAVSFEHHKNRYRYVVRVATSYVVTAWVLLQVMDVTFSRVGLGETSERLFLYVLVAGFVPAVIIAWLADLKANRQEAASEREEKRIHTEPAARAVDHGMPSLAVLPFANLSGDASRTYLADGVTDEIVTLLSQLPDIFIISHNSVMAFKNRDADVRQVAEELRVRYILQGSVRAGSGRVRVTAQLIEAASGAQVWADKYEGAEDTIFDMQDEVAQEIAGMLGGQIMREEIQRIDRDEPDNLDAWGHYIHAQDFYYRQSQQNLTETVACASEAIAMDPKFAQAHSLLAVALSVQIVVHTAPDRASAWALCESSITTALSLAPDHPRVLCECANANSNLGHHDRALQLAILAVEKAPCFASATSILGVTYLTHGDADQAIHYLQYSISRSPRDSQLSMWLYQLSWAYTIKGELETALEYADRSVERNPYAFLAWGSKANLEGQLGRIEAARRSVARAKELLPRLNLAIAEAATRQFYKDPETGLKITQGLRAAGLE